MRPPALDGIPCDNVQTQSQSASSGSGTCKSGQRGSLASRFSRLEDNMRMNMEMLQEHRRFTFNIREQRQADAERQKHIMAEACKIDLNVATAQMATRRKNSEQLSRDRDIPTGDRVPDFQQHALLSVRGQLRQRPRVEYDAVQGERACRTPRAVEESARWMGPALQATARAKADLEDKRSNPGTARGSVSARAPVESFRGSSASQASKLQESRPASATTDGEPSSVASGCISLRGPNGTRPTSAGSMSARCRALEDNMRRNRMLLDMHRGHIDGVHTDRKQRDERMAREILEDLKTALGMPRD